MQLYERAASAVIGTSLQGPAESLRWLVGLPQRWKHPELHEIYVEGERIQRVLSAVISDGTNCIDVGCHLGSVLQRMVDLSPSGRHLAVEPISYKAKWLTKKFPNVDVHQLALGDSDGASEFFYSDRRSAYSSLRANRRAGDLKRILVDRGRLDEIAPRDRRFGFLKIDVEGGEYAVLRGAMDLISANRPLILFECTRSGLSMFGQSAEQIYDLLTREAHYSVYLLKDWLANGQQLLLSDFEASMIYPFKAFNFIAAPITSFSASIARHAGAS